MSEPTISLRDVKERNLIFDGRAAFSTVTLTIAERDALVEAVEASIAHNAAHLAFIDNGSEELQVKREPLRRAMQAKLARFTEEGT